MLSLKSWIAGAGLFSLLFSVRGSAAPVSYPESEDSLIQVSPNSVSYPSFVPPRYYQAYGYDLKVSFWQAGAVYYFNLYDNITEFPNWDNKWYTIGFLYDYSPQLDAFLFRGGSPTPGCPSPRSGTLVLRCGYSIASAVIVESNCNYDITLSAPKLCFFGPSPTVAPTKEPDKTSTSIASIIFGVFFIAAFISAIIVCIKRYYYHLNRVAHSNAPAIELPSNGRIMATPQSYAMINQVSGVGYVGGAGGGGMPIMPYNGQNFVPVTSSQLPPGYQPQPVYQLQQQLGYTQQQSQSQQQQLFTVRSNHSPTVLAPTMAVAIPLNESYGGYSGSVPVADAVIFN